MNVDNIAYSEGSPTDLMAGPFRLNRCYYMDNKYGERLLPDNLFDICITDPPYNIKCHLPGVDRKGSNKITYQDKKTEEIYWKELFEWFEITRQKSKIIVFTPGYTNARKWLRHYDFWYCCWTDKSKQGACKIAWFSKFELILTYGIEARKQKDRLKMALFDFCNADMTVKYIHPCPKPVQYFDYFIDQLSGINFVLDPFMGSGGLAESAEKHGLYWLGFEIKEKYRSDIERRIKLGIKERKKPKKTVLDRWI